MNSYCKRQVLIFYRLEKKKLKKKQMGGEFIFEILEN